MAATTLALPILFAQELSPNARFDGDSAAGDGSSSSTPLQQLTDCLTVDCTDPSPTHPHIITHHKGQNAPAEIMADTTSGSVLNALLFGGGVGHPVLHGARSSTTNHFDIDSFVSVWCLQNPVVAVAHQAVLRRMAHIGDFRELGSIVAAAPADEAVCEVERRALALCCWLNSQERLRFYRPFAEEVPASR